MSINSIPLRTNGTSSHHLHHHHHHTYDPLFDHPPQSRITRTLDHYFHITERGSSVAVEIRSGLVTFVTMAYILIVNADVLSRSGIDSYGQSMPFGSIATATAITAAFGSAVVGLTGNLPFGLAPGMGLNSYFTYGICLRVGLSWHVALTTCFVQGVLFLILSLCGACNLIQQYAPACIKKSITVGLGLFQALIGFECMKLVIRGNDGVLLAIGNILDPHVLLALVGLIIICICLVLNIKASMLIGMGITTMIAWCTGLAAPPATYVEMPTLEGTFLQLDFIQFWQNSHTTIPIVLVLLFVSVFDTAGVQFAAGSQADLIIDGKLPGSTAAFSGASLATMLGACVGSSPIIIHNETCAGIQDGARTGLSAVTVALCFILTLPFGPILRAVPPLATAAPLVIVGMFMMTMVKYIDWESVDEAMPAFLTATMLPFTYSIANGMLFGLISYTVIKVLVYIYCRITGHELPETMQKVDTQPGILHDPMPGTPLTPFVDRKTFLKQRAQRSAENSPMLSSHPHPHQHISMAPAPLHRSGSDSIKQYGSTYDSRF